MCSHILIFTLIYITHTEQPLQRVLPLYRLVQLLRVTHGTPVGQCIAQWTHSPWQLFNNRNSIGCLNGRKSIDRIIALRSITSIGALLDSNLLVRSACRSIGSHTNWLLHCGMGLSWFCYMYVYFSVSSCELSFVYFYPWSLKFLPSKFFEFYFMPLSSQNFLFYPRASKIQWHALELLKISSLPLRFWNCVECPSISSIFLFFYFFPSSSSFFFPFSLRTFSAYVFSFFSASVFFYLSFVPLPFPCSPVSILFTSFPFSSSVFCASFCLPRIFSFLPFLFLVLLLPLAVFGPSPSTCASPLLPCCPLSNRLASSVRGHLLATVRLHLGHARFLGHVLVVRLGNASWPYSRPRASAVFWAVHLGRILGRASRPRVSAYFGPRISANILASRLSYAFRRISRPSFSGHRLAVLSAASWPSSRPWSFSTVAIGRAVTVRQSSDLCRSLSVVLQGRLSFGCLHGRWQSLSVAVSAVVRVPAFGHLSDHRRPLTIFVRSIIQPSVGVVG